MAARSWESPMDFQWQSGHGPSSSDSPFMKYTGNNMQSRNGPAGQKRDFDHFDSPKKSLLPVLRDTNAQTPMMPSTPTMKPPLQFRNSSFTTPRRQIDTDFSSGPENQSSPLADNEDTPEQPAPRGVPNTNAALVMFQGNRSGKESPTRSILTNYPAPGRGEGPRRHYNDVARRGLKRRRRDPDGRDVRLARRRPSDDSDYEDHARVRSGSSASKPDIAPQTIGTIPSILTFMHAHPDLPDILSRYAQFILNLFFVALLMFIVYCVLATVRSDVDEASREVAAETMAEMVACTRDFKDNKCDSAERVPAMESMCNSWQKCMNRDPAMVGRARVSAQTFAEIITSFVDRISYKTMLFCSILFLGCWAMSNVSMTVWRHKVQRGEQAFNPSKAHAQQLGFAHSGPNPSFHWQAQPGYWGQGTQRTQSPTKHLEMQ